MASEAQTQTVYTQQGLLGNLGTLDFVHKLDYNLPQLAAATGIIVGGVFVGWALMQLVKRKTT